ncbi:MarR family winged helix-turn-helix transcriptional regulator [Paenibacillus sp. YN15]|uniref:MarR family winged helix-turn-helix transcriptional regulator n=1 Tax=Paenibacillus sp. YN15 TaxID=1742774 RepID=UPI000DCBAC2D|nr:MarR family transcriptional regulator [Paenibacillus sp. YN15]RAV02064.1 MarR family transcriptional regulator [Paenibacillus sp. YN15]
MESNKLDALISRYEDVYLFATRMIASIVAELVQEMTMEQYFAVRFLTKHGPCPASRLAEACGVNRSAVTAMVDRLVIKGYVARIRDEGDRRVVYLQTTEAGQAVYHATQEKIRQFVEFYLQQLEEEEAEAFIRIYEKISTIISKTTGGEQA